MILRPFRASVAAGLLAAAAVSAPVSAEEFSPAAKSEIEEIVRQYILQNPEIIQEALINLEEKRKQEEAAARTAAVQSVSETLFESPRHVSLGNPDGPIKVVEFFDYNCGYCKRALNDTKALLDQGDVEVILKELPILSPESTEAARVAIAVSMVAPDRYLEFHTELLGGSARANEVTAMAVVDDLGIDVEAVRKAMDDPEVAATIEESYSLANKLGLSGTPSYVVGDEVVFGAVGFAALNERVASIRECGKTVC